MKDRSVCMERGGFWYSYGIHAQDWIPCEMCEDGDCPRSQSTKDKKDEDSI